MATAWELMGRGTSTFESLEATVEQQQVLCPIGHLTLYGLTECEINQSINQGGPRHQKGWKTLIYRINK
jgi:hypothetical protein